MAGRHRVLRLITWLPNGGIERKIAALLPRLNPDRFEAQVCCIRDRGPLADELEAAGIPVHLIPFRGRWDPFALRRLRRLVVEQRISLVHAHMYRANTPATALKWSLPHLRVVGQYHNVDTWESARQRRMDAWLARRRDLNVAVSQAVRENVARTLNLPASGLRTIYNGVDLHEFRPVATADRHAIRERLGWPASIRVAVMSARLVPQKNHAFVLRCAAEILRVEPRARFVFAGGGGEEENLRRLAVELGLGEHAVFMGERDDVADLLAASDVFMLPSLREGFSNSIIEAMACGLPAVVSGVGGAREVVSNGRNGFVVDAIAPAGGAAVEVSAPQFVRHLKRLLVDDDYRIRLGANAAQDARRFSLDNMVRDVEEMYLELLGEGPGVLSGAASDMAGRK
jgi:glycosyltransferase involved in cell wall biosynthesis